MRITAVILLGIVALCDGCTNWPYIPGKMMQAPTTNAVHEASNH